MAQIFHPSANTIAKASIFGAVFVAAFVGYCAAGYDRSVWHTRAGYAKAQPVPFSHEHHVRGLGIDCRYCHTSVETSHFAGIPSTKTCMTCHSQVWTGAALLEPVRESWRTNRPIEWNRVHNLPEFVYFNHSIHVNKGIGCSSCHGQVDKMPLMWQEGSLQMEWCLNCHRDPAKFVRPRAEIYNLNYDPAMDPSLPANMRSQETLGPQLVKDYHIHTEQLTNCSICHR
ncbi:MAG TPA: cytochrome c3 family protein [Tepidisphaeraceae bacterium]|nr:cytochrome c3 family protein [Tepidisphaeraceae bacterium]